MASFANRQIFDGGKVFISENNDCSEEFYVCDEKGLVKKFSYFEEFFPKEIYLDTICISFMYLNNIFYVANDEKQVLTWDSTSLEINDIFDFNWHISMFDVSQDSKLISVNHLINQISIFNIETKSLFAFQTLCPIVYQKFHPKKAEFLFLIEDSNAFSIFSTLKLYMLKRFTIIDYLEPKHIWLNTGNMFGMAIKNQIDFYENVIWQKKFTIDLKNDNSPIEILFVSKNDMFVIVVTREKKVHIFNFISFDVIHRIDLKRKSKILSGLVFDNRFLLSYDDGSIQKINTSLISPIPNRNEYSKQLLTKFFDEDKDENIPINTNCSNKDLIKNFKF
ncbi:unnamed protein product [Brachionus calyciflorus]|uniref:Uncharacterized protein n=1 Tax=Brachionus calyciflorus TaxID=104777 RepID=A0A814N3W2_9BILA|nr:unnamed protein product [Brachionus calyciflorus]